MFPVLSTGYLLFVNSDSKLGLQTTLQVIDQPQHFFIGLQQFTYLILSMQDGAVVPTAEEVADIGQ